VFCLRFNPSHEPQATSYACITVPSMKYLMFTTSPTFAETSVTDCVLSKVRSWTSFPVGLLEGRYMYPKVTNNYVVNCHKIKHFSSSRHKEFGHIVNLMLASIGGMKDAGFDLELSFSVFGDQPDIMMFGYKTKLHRYLFYMSWYLHTELTVLRILFRPATALWAMTVRQPMEIDFFQCPEGIKTDLRAALHSDPGTRNQSLWSRQGHAGKVAMCNMIRTAELRGGIHQCEAII
jgi:hypothetical protein